jgi:hypothetical protein
VRSTAFYCGFFAAKQAVLSKRRYPEQLEATTGH